MARSSSSTGRTLGLWMVGAGLNYVPLAAYATALIRPGALEQELQGVDTGRELRRYSLLQFWVFVPLALLLLAGRQRLATRGNSWRR